MWEGTAFDCPLSSNEIQLRHTQFIGSIGVCNDGDICGHAVAILSPDCFVSRLNVHVTMYGGPEGHSSVDGSRVRTPTIDQSTVDGWTFKPPTTHHRATCTL